MRVQLVILCLFAGVAAAEDGAGPSPAPGSELVEFRAAAKEVGDSLKARLETECAAGKKKQCLIELLPIKPAAGLLQDDLDLILLGVMDSLRNFRFWGSQEFRQQTRERLQTLSVYDPAAVEKFLRSGQGERYQLACALTENKREHKVALACQLAVMAALIFGAQAEFHHPDHIKAVREEAARREQESQARTAAREREQQAEAQRIESTWSAIRISAGALAFGLVCLVAVLLLKRSRKRRFLLALPRVKEQIQVHLERGQFMAAEELIRRALHAVPEDTELLGAGNRLQIVTCGDARRAEEAWLKRRWAEELRAQDRGLELLPGLGELKALAPYNPELAEICTELDRTREVLEREKVLMPRLAEVEQLRDQGRLTEAIARLALILAEAPESRKAAALSGSLELVRSETRDLLASGKDLLLQGRFAEAGQAFSRALEKDRSLSAARELAEQLPRARVERGLRLVPPGTARPVHLCCQERIGCGRELAEISIDDHLVSREHCLIALRQGRVLVEDRGSKNGTFVRGQQIASDTLQDGDELSLANAHAFRCRIHQAGGDIQAVVLDGQAGAFVLLRGRLPIRLCGRELSTAGPDEELVLVEREGIKVVLAITPAGLCVLSPGRKATLGGIDYRVEVLQ